MRGGLWCGVCVCVAGVGGGKDGGEWGGGTGWVGGWWCVCVCGGGVVVWWGGGCMRRGVVAVCEGLWVGGRVGGVVDGAKRGAFANVATGLS